jgi:hypothetical protein
LGISCSSVIFLKEVERLGFKMEYLFGIDISEKAIENLKKNGIQNALVKDARKIDLPNKFDVILASECLGHLLDYTLAIRNWCELIEDWSDDVCFAPAFKSLWSTHNEVNIHFRRDITKELQDKLTSGNLTILKSSYWNFFLFIPLYLFRKTDAVLSRNKKKEGQIIDGIIVNAVLLQLLLFEN